MGGYSNESAWWGGRQDKAFYSLILGELRNICEKLPILGGFWENFVYMGVIFNFST